MAALQKGLGRGLGALFQDEPATEVSVESALTLPVGSLFPNPNQPRRDFDDEALAGLAESIKSQGVLQPILVRPVAGSKPPRYEIVAGERRWRASKLAGLPEVPVLIRELSDQDTLAIALVENLQREDLNALEEALGISELKHEFSLSQEELSKTLGKSRSAIANSLRLLNLSPKGQEALRSSAISAGHARAILSLDTEAEQDALLGKIIQENLTVRDAEGWAAAQKAGLKAENGNVTNADGAKGKKKRPQSAILLDLQGKISESVGLPVRFSGKESRGKVSISYSSKDELKAFLDKIGITAEF